MADTNHQIRLASRPTGMPDPSNWESRREPLPQPAVGEILVGIEYISLDPAMRGWMNAGKSYIPPVGIGEVMRAGAAGTVIFSRHPDFRAGDHVTGNLGVQTHAVAGPADLRKVDTSLAPLTTYLGTLGMPGMTAYFGLLEIAAAKRGDTVVISAASGAVGAVAAQIARLKGCRVVGIAGGPKKCAYVRDELGLDAVVDYKSEDVAEKLGQQCPDGIDVYFDNVGGDILDAVLTQLAMHARVVICGAISQYNATEGIRGPSNYLALLVKRARMEGFVVFDFADRYPEAARAMAQWLQQGELKTREHVVAGGIDAFPETLLKLFTGENFGKLILKVGP